MIDGLNNTIKMSSNLETVIRGAFWGFLIAFGLWLAELWSLLDIFACEGVTCAFAHTTLISLPVIFIFIPLSLLLNGNIFISLFISYIIGGIIYAFIFRVISKQPKLRKVLMIIAKVITAIIISAIVGFIGFILFF